MHSRWFAALDHAVNIFHNAWIRSTPLGFPNNPNPTEPISHPAMNRHLFNVIAHLGSSSRRAGAWMALVEGPKAEGMQPQVGYAHDRGRDRHDTHTSGEGSG
jgi:hypothetical protein